MIRSQLAAKIQDKTSHNAMGAKPGSSYNCVEGAYNAPFTCFSPESKNILKVYKVYEKLLDL